MKIKINFDNNELYCVYSKEIIQVGEKYAEIYEDDFAKCYKLEYAPIDNEYDEPYIG